MLEALALSKTYRSGPVTVEALCEVAAAFARGSVTAIVGPSGSGKSTLLNLLALFDQPSGGEVRLDGRSLGELSEGERCELRLRNFGFVFQSFNLFNVLTAEQNVAFSLGLAGVDREARLSRARALLARFGLANRVDHLPTRLSGGERQRVALARALANDPAVVFADEPTGNLDSRSGAAVLAALREVADDGRTVVVVTHDPQVAAIADQRIELRDGRVVSPETAAAMPQPGVPAASPPGAGTEP